MKYYYCIDSETENFLTSDGVPISHFLITPADYYDRKGFLSDRQDAVNFDHLPPNFKRCADSCFEFRGHVKDGLAVLKAARGFIMRDMEKEIKELYRRRDALKNT